MKSQLDANQLQSAREALLSESSERLLDLIFRLNLGQPIPSELRGAVEQAVWMDWVVDPARPRLSPLGMMVADPIREYRFWLDRDRKIHGESEYDLLKPENYRGKSVLEPGSGFGCNLMSLMRRTAGEFIGVEPMAIYRQFSILFAEREGMPAPEVVAGQAEDLPFEDGRFDVVLCYSAHQYMDITVALQEMARVLAPGGQLQIIGATMDTYLAAAWNRLRQKFRPSETIRCAVTTANTVCYQSVGRRMYSPNSGFSTSAPIYPSYRAMCRWMSQAGLVPREDLVRYVGTERCMVADKTIR